MKKIVSTLSLLTFLALSAQADDMMIRVGMVSFSDIEQTISSNNGSNKVYAIDKDETGWEVSIVSGIDTEPGFDVRSGFTFQSVEIEERSSMSLIGEYDFAYKINQFASPFIGFSGGLDYIDFNSNNVDNTLGYQFGFYVGVDGLVYEGLGYYVKYGKAYKGHADSNSDMITQETSSMLKFGLGYQF